MDYPEDKDKRNLEDSINDLEDAVENNLEPSVEEQNQYIEEEYGVEESAGLTERISDKSSEMAENFSDKISKNGDKEKREERETSGGMSRRGFFKTATIAGLAAVGAGGAYTVLADENPDVLVSDNEAVNNLVDEYRFSRNETLESIGRDMESVIETDPDRDYEIGLADSLGDNQIKLTADNILQREYTGLDAVTYSQAESKAQEIISNYEE